MKKNIVMAGALAAAMAAGIVGTESQPQQQTGNQQQMSRANQPNRTPQQQPVSASEIKQFSQQLADLYKHQPTYYQTFSPNGRKWCDMGGSGAYNKLKHGRNMRRKHRRAA